MMIPTVQIMPSLSYSGWTAYLLMDTRDNIHERPTSWVAALPLKDDDWPGESINRFPTFAEAQSFFKQVTSL